MDPRLRLQHGLVVDQSGQVVGRGSGGLAGLSPYSLSLLQSQLSSERARQDLAAQSRAQANANALRAASGLVPSLSSGQGFYTVESLQGATSVGQDGLVGHSQLPSHDAARGFAGGYLGAGQQGIDAATFNQLLAHQAASQKLLATAPSAGMAPLLLPSHHSVPMEVNTGGVVGRGGGKGGPLYMYQPYAQSDLPLGTARYVQQASQVPAETILRMREREREREQERDRERERERDRERTRERDRRDEWARERRRDSDRRRESERRHELDKRRDLERRRDTEYEARAKDRLKQRDTGHKKKASRASPVTLRHDNTKSKGLRARGQKEKGWCSLCQVDCNTEEMLGRHLDGKKHKSRVEAEAQKKELSKKPENIEANKGEKVTEGDEVGKMLTEEQVEKDGATANLEAKKANKGKVNAKVNTRKKNSKFSKPGSKADASSAEVNDKGVVNETVEKLEKVETEATIDKVEIPVKELGSEEELQDVEVETIEKVREEKGDEVIKLEQIEELVEANVASKLEEGDAKFQVSEVMEEAAVNTEDVAKTLVGDFDMVKDEQEVIASVLILEDKASGSEIVKEVNNGNPETKALSNQNILTGIAAQSQGKESVLGKRNLEIDGEPPSAKKTRQLKKKGAGTSPSVQTETVRCEVCKVTCRNATVYETHLKREKHTERLKKVQTPTSKTGKTTKLVDNKVAEEAPNTG